jgi:hypothetical protein
VSPLLFLSCVNLRRIACMLMGQNTRSAGLFPKEAGKSVLLPKMLGIFGSELLSSWTFLGKHKRRGEGIIRERVCLATYETAFRVPSYGSA